MNSKQFFKQLGMLLYGIDGIYDEYGRKNIIASTNVLWVLYALNDDEKHSQKDICDGWSIPRTTINTIIKDLEKKQMVEMIPIFGKRRKKYKNSWCDCIYKWTTFNCYRIKVIWWRRY